MNKIIIELSAEDRARLDRLTEALTRAAEDTTREGCRCQAQTVKAPKETTEEAEASPAPVIQPGEEKPSEVKTEAVQPSVTLAQIQQKVIQLAAGANANRKAKVREVINAYAPKVSALPEDKWGEVWDRLNKLSEE